MNLESLPGIVPIEINVPIPIITAFRNCSGYRAIVPKSINTIPENIQSEGIDVSVDGEIVRTYCPSVLFNDNKRACAYFCLSKGARRTMCTTEKYQICATYQRNRDMKAENFATKDEILKSLQIPEEKRKTNCISGIGDLVKEKLK